MSARKDSAAKQIFVGVTVTVLSADLVAWFRLNDNSPNRSGSSSSANASNEGYIDSYLMACRGGGAMNVNIRDNEIRIWFNKAPRSNTEHPVESGQCSWIDRAIGPNEPSKLYFSGSTQDKTFLVRAVQSDSQFFIYVRNNAHGSFLITRVVGQ